MLDTDIIMAGLADDLSNAIEKARNKITGIDI